MTKRSVTCKPWDVVVVPFPFSERPASRRRPALVLSRRGFNKAGHTVLAMITTSAATPWPGDTPIEDLESAGLRVACRVRLKLFTLDNRLVVRRLGSLSASDRDAVTAGLRTNIEPGGP